MLATSVQSTVPRGTGAAADVAGGGRTIEVKAYGQYSRGQDLWLEPRQKNEAASDPDFWIYIVEKCVRVTRPTSGSSRSEATTFSAS